MRNIFMTANHRLCVKKQERDILSVKIICLYTQLFMSPCPTTNMPYKIREWILSH